MKAKILLIVEGEKEETRILGNNAHGLLKLIDADYEIVPFSNPIYELYDLYKKGEYDDIVQFLRFTRGLKIPSSVLSKNAFSAIYLIFDFDPHYQKYSDDVIKDIINVFNDETENGKVYINYPMVEAFYHLNNLPDSEFYDRVISLDGLTGDKYKRIVNEESVIKKNKISNYILRLIIKANYEKARRMVCDNEVSQEAILEKQIEMKNKINKIYVLSTFPFIVIDYNNDIIDEL